MSKTVMSPTLAFSLGDWPSALHSSVVLLLPPLSPHLLVLLMHNSLSRNLVFHFSNQSTISMFLFTCNEFIVLGTAAVTTLPAISYEEYPASVVEALSLNRTSFPEGFVFGTASAAYQVYALNQTYKCFCCSLFYFSHIANVYFM